MRDEAFETRTDVAAVRRPGICYVHRVQRDVVRMIDP